MGNLISFRKVVVKVGGSSGAVFVFGSVLISDSERPCVCVLFSTSTSTSTSGGVNPDLLRSKSGDLLLLPRTDSGVRVMRFLAVLGGLGKVVTASRSGLNPCWLSENPGQYCQS